ncbi:MAG: ArsA family ATPase [Methanobacteriota archaeon]|nr:MAG: ArsA family ATPase [Euryarchaeota archaeon]
MDLEIVVSHRPGDRRRGEGEGQDDSEGHLVHEALPIAVITRFIGWFHEFGIPIGGVIVNMVMDRQALGADVPEFVLNRMRMQDDHMKTIGEKFDGRVRAIVPLFDEEVRGTTMLARAAVALFA